RRYSDDTPGVVTRLKKHPAMLRLIDERVTATARLTENVLTELARKEPAVEAARTAWLATETRPLVHRVASLRSWLTASASQLTPMTRNILSRELDKAEERARDVVGLWADLLTDRTLLGEGMRSEE